MPFKFDANNNLDVNLAAGSISGGNAAAGTTGTPVPANADYQGVNVGGTLVGVTGFTVGSSTGEAVAIIDGSGNQITSFGGGTQFADNAASGATPTGTLEMGWDSGNSKVRALKVDASQNLNVNVAASTTVPVSGTFFQATQPVSIAATVAENLTQVGGSAVTLGAKTSANSIPVVLASDEAALHTIVDSGSITANAGTNLNTSALLLDATFTGRINTLGSKVSASSTPVVIASDQSSIPVTLTSTTISSGTVTANIGTTGGLALDSSLTTLDTDLKATQPRDITDRSARLLGHVTVDSAPTTAVTGTFFQATQPVSAVSLPLPTNAAQETGGNLAAILAQQTLAVTQTRNDAQILDVLNCILAQLKLLNMNLASSMPSAHMDADTWLMDVVPVLN